MKAVAMLLGSLMLLLPALLEASTVEDDLSLARQERNFTGHAVEVMTIHGQLPRATLRFTEGNRAVIRVHDRMRRHPDQHAVIELTHAYAGFLSMPDRTQDSDL